MSVKGFGSMQALSQPTLDLLAKLGFDKPTPVQEAVIPVFSGNKDVAVDACTGSGKTLAFVIPVAERLRGLEEPLLKHQVGAIIVSPTRELAGQIHSVAEPFFASIPDVKTLLLVGGTDVSKDVSQFTVEGANVLIGTPGRLLDIMQQSSAMNLKRLEVFVLDEADRLLDMGFRTQLDAIMQKLPKQRRTGLFSATQTEAVIQLARAGLRNAVRIKVAVVPSAEQQQQQSDRVASGQTAGPSGAQRTPSSLEIQYQICDNVQKLQQLVEFIQDHQDDKVIVYFLTCASVDFFQSALTQLPDMKAAQLYALHGKMKQAAREAVMSSYTGSPAGCLLCTDVAARGLDIPGVSWIVQYDPPQDPSTFVHRVGRTARMGRSGNALVMLLPHEEPYVDFLRLRKVPMKEQALAGCQGTVHAELRKLSEQDRDIMEKGIKAFVSFVRAYKEHQCKFIFRLADLELAQLATALGLLRLPKMPEMSKAKQRLESFTPSTLDPNDVKFKDKARQKQRQQTLKLQMSQEKPSSAKAQNRNKSKTMVVQPVKKAPAAKRRLLEKQEDDACLVEDYRQLKKLKNGRISQHQFNQHLGISSDSEADS
ncbi:TPA: hypothetical protein ACH3X2_009290 [Trebouxia sp. C0005]